MLEITHSEKITKSTEKNFGIVFGTFFLILGIYIFFFLNSTNFIIFLISIFFYLFSFFYPKIFTIPNNIWHKFGLILNKITSPIIMGIIFYLVVTPTGIIMKILRKDLLKQKLIKSKKSYWIERKLPVESMKNQF